MNREKFVSGFLYWGAVAALLLLGGKFVLPVCLPLLAGGALAVVLRPWALRLHRAARLPYRLSAVLVMALFLAAAALVLWYLGSLLLYQASGLVARLPQTYLTTIEPLLREVSGRVLDFLGSLAPDTSQHIGGVADAIGQYTKTLLSSASASMLAALGSLAAKVPPLLVSLSFAVLTAFFMLMDYRQVTDFLRRRLSARWYASVRDGVGFVTTTGKNVVKAYFLIMVITFGEVSLGLWLLGVEYYLVAGLAVAVLDILPILGSGAVLVPWGLCQLLAGRFHLGAGILLLWGGVTVVRTFLEPKIVGDRIGLHPLATILSMYLGMRLGGVAGLILAPMAATLLLYLDRRGHLRALG